MIGLQEKIKLQDWEYVSQSLSSKGYAIIPRLLSKVDCETLKACYSEDGLFRKTVVMERYRFGSGEYRYFRYPLPEIIQTLRTLVYPKLAPIANLWMKALKIDKAFPAEHTTLLKKCAAQGQKLATPLILKYRKGGYNTLHQDLYGEIYFPMQAVLFLNEEGKDYQGGEFVLTEQVPRAQSKAIVLRPKLGDMLIFCTNFRPVRGKKGYYRVSMKHGVSEVLEGERHTLGIIFHDAQS
ncbi:2OG-Fe(II) oxygenase [Spongiimicrobium sp. 3-5]|uniref:2OG-Fe(II) oxygenase n=1 Tax=Spongiimicrobium sp. 3-5 TaxID=3332596 RepID=UPI003980C833